jgi:hypothetical protein
LRAVFAPDNERIIVSTRTEAWGRDFDVVDPSRSIEHPDTSIARSRRSDRWPVVAPDGDTGAVPSCRSEGSPVALSLFSLDHGRGEDVDTIAPDQHYGQIEFSSTSEFLAYTKGDEDAYDAAYVDLRYSRRRAVRLPGEGNVYALEFDPSGRGLFYVREHDNGARDCFYLDLTAQVAKDPVKVSRDGRVEWCAAQTSTN